MRVSKGPQDILQELVFGEEDQEVEHVSTNTFQTLMDQELLQLEKAGGGKGIMSLSLIHI